MNQQWPFKEFWHFYWLCHSVESLKLRSMHYSKYMYYSPYTYSKSFSFNGPLNADSVTWLDGRCCCKDFLSILCRSSEKLCTYLSTVKEINFVLYMPIWIYNVITNIKYLHFLTHIQINTDPIPISLLDNAPNYESWVHYPKKILL